jgi:hypothetical protein
MGETNAVEHMIERKTERDDEGKSCKKETKVI